MSGGPVALVTGGAVGALARGDLDYFTGILIDVSAGFQLSRL